MPKEIISVQAEDGSLHPTMLDAVRHETVTLLRRDYPELKSLLDNVRFNNVCLVVRDYANMLHEQTLPKADTTLAPEPPGEPTPEPTLAVAFYNRRRHAVDQMRANRVLAAAFFHKNGWMNESHFGSHATVEAINEWDRVLAESRGDSCPEPTLDDAKLADLHARRRHAVDQMRAKPNRILAETFLSMRGFMNLTHFGSRAAAQSIDEWDRTLAEANAQIAECAGLPHTPLNPSDKPKIVACVGIGQAREERYSGLDRAQD